MIYCVEDDKSIREILIYTLESTGFQARGFAEASEFFDALSQEKPELILLDIMLPDQDGIQILKKLKAGSEAKDIPVILATAKGSEIDKVQGLDLGADDYLVKPFGMMEMVSRVKAVLRRSSTNSSKNELQAGPIIMKLKEHKVFNDGKELKLTRKEFDLLKLFLSRPGSAFSREFLMQEIWNLEFLDSSRTVDMHIRSLRKKLGEAGDMIQTIRGLGYRMET